MRQTIRTTHLLPERWRLPFYSLAIVLSLMLIPAMAQEQGGNDDAAQESLSEPPMTLDRLAEIAEGIDPEYQRDGNILQVTINEIAVLVVTDPSADRMRAMVPIRSTDGLTAEELSRLMQANFDTALDARYAIAQGRVWSTFIHPLSPLEKNQFLSGLGQVVNLATSYGTLYSSGGLSFGGGDSGKLQRELIEDLLKRGEEI